jgi:hypothetical protein
VCTSVCPVWPDASTTTLTGPQATLCGWVRLIAGVKIYSALRKQDLLNALADGQPIGVVGVDFAAVNQGSMAQVQEC